MRAKIIGTGRAVPELIVHNKDFEKFLDTTDEWIEERTCMKQRYIAILETALSLGTEAAKKAIEAAGISPSEIDILLCSTATPDTVYPNLACLIQAEIGNNTAMCFDLNAACTGFLYAASTAHAYISSGMAKTVLVVSSEVTTKTLDYTDRSSCVLFGDGAAAAVFTTSKDKGIKETVLHSDGRKADSIFMESAPITNYWCEFAKNERKVTDNASEEQRSIEVGTEKNAGTRTYMSMDGKAVYSFATRTVPESVKDLLEKADTSINDIEWFVFHQANGRMLEVIAKKLGIPMEKVPINVENYGNTSSASIPILLDEMVRDGRIKSGDKIVLSGFGAGLTWGALLIEW